MPVLRIIFHPSHDPVDNHKKDHRGTASSLAGLLRLFRKIRHVKVPDRVNELRWNSIVMHKLPAGISVSTVEEVFCHSLECLMIILRMAIWSVQNCLFLSLLG